MATRTTEHSATACQELQPTASSSRRPHLLRAEAEQPSLQSEGSRGALQGGGNVLRATEGSADVGPGADLRARASGSRGRSIKTCKEGKHPSANGGAREVPERKVSLLRGAGGRSRAEGGMGRPWYGKLLKMENKTERVGKIRRIKSRD